MTDGEDESMQPNHAAQAARALAAIQPSTTPPPIADRAAAIDAIERALRSRARRRWQRRWVLPSAAVAAAAAAASLVLVIGSNRVGLRRGGSGPVVTRTGADDPLGPGTELQGPGSFEIAAGTRLRLDDRAGARVLEAGTSRRFRLRTGALHAQVAKLSPNQRFVVETPDAEVEVKGTRFDVTVGPRSARCAPATQTSVTVEEGVVAVRFEGRELRLGPGQSWPDCQTAVGVAGAAPSPARDEAQPALAKVGEVGQAGEVGTKRGDEIKNTIREKIAGKEPSPPARGSAAGWAGALAHGKAIRAVGVQGRPRSAGRATAGPDGAAPAGASTLAEQNDLMAAALSARQRGNVAEALRWLDRLLDRYPGGQLAGSARAERRRLRALGKEPAPPEPR